MTSRAVGMLRSVIDLVLFHFRSESTNRNAERLRGVSAVVVAQSIGDLQPLNEARGPFRRIGQRAGEVEGIAESVRPCVAEVEIGAFDDCVVAEDCRAFKTVLQL